MSLTDSGKRAAYSSEVDRYFVSRLQYVDGNTMAVTMIMLVVSKQDRHYFCVYSIAGRPA